MGIIFINTKIFRKSDAVNAVQIINGRGILILAILNNTSYLNKVDVS